ncbi:MAG: GEVED domain-containing protein [Prevotellaceae bacterium]|jgi:hypothetical protein|nr:GEVED domain-containing protein [Prevotellaceae bacterium]
MRLFLILVAALCGFEAAAQCELSASVTKTNSDCEANGTVRINIVDTSRFINIRCGLFAKTSSSYPPAFQDTTVLMNVPRGTYDVRVAARCKTSSLDSVYYLGEVKITGNYVVPNMYVYVSGVIKPLKGGTAIGRIPIRFEGGKAPYTAIMTAHPAAYTGQTNFTLTRDQAQASQNTLNITDLPAGSYTFALKDDCGTNAPAQVFMLEELVIPRIWHEAWNSCTSNSNRQLVFSAWQMDDDKKIALTIRPFFCSYYNNTHPDYASFQYYFGNNNYSYDIQYYEQWYGGDTIRGYSIYNSGIKNFDIALVENDNTANKKLGLALDSMKVNEYSYSGPDYYYRYVYYKYFFVLELDNLRFSDMYGQPNNGYDTPSPVSFVLKAKTATDWSDTLNYFDLRHPGATYTMDNKGCTGTGDLYVKPVEYTIYQYSYYNWYSGRNPFLTYPVTVRVTPANGGAPVLTKTIPYVRGDNASLRDNWGSSPEALDSRLYTIPKDSLIGTLPYGSYKITFTDADGVEYFSSIYRNYYNINSIDSVKFYKYKYLAQVQQLGSCTENGATGYLYLQSNNSTEYWYNGYNTSSYSSGPFNHQTTTVNGEPRLYVYSYYYRSNRGYHHSVNVFMPGTVITYLSGPPGQAIPDSVITIPADKAHLPVFPFADRHWIKDNNNSNSNYDTYEDMYTPPSIILPGVHKFEILSPCGDRDTVTFTMPEVHANYRADANNHYIFWRNGGYNSNYHINRFNIDKVSAGISTNDWSLTIPGGTIIECTNYPAGHPPRHTSITVPSGLYTVYPFHEDFTGGNNGDYNNSNGYMTETDRMAFSWAEAYPGTYTFKITDGACGDVVIVTMYVPQASYISDSLDYTLKINCLGRTLHPTGTITVPGTSHRTFFWIDRLVLEDGTVANSNDYDRRVVYQGDSLQLQRNGTYYIAMSAWNSNDYNWGYWGNYWYGVQVKEVKYKQPLPALDPDLTYAFVCVGETVGQIGLVATGGYGNGPFKYQIIKKDGDTLTNYTGTFTYGDPNELLEYIITDESAEAIALACQGFLHKKDRLVLDLNNPHILYTPTGGKYCAGDTLKVNCYSLGPGAIYNWTWPDGSTHTGQNQKRPHSTTGMSGWYKVSVQVPLCSASPYVKDSIYVSVYNSPSAPSVQYTWLNGCYGGAAFNLADSVKAVASPGCLLRWYHYVGPYLTEMSSGEINSVAFNSYTDKEYYVKQIFATTECESPMVKITLHSLYSPSGPIADIIPPGCYNDPLTISIKDPADSLTYRLYTSGGILLDTQPGSDVSVEFNTVYPASYYWITAAGTHCESMRTRIQPSLNTSAYQHLLNVNNVSVCFNSTATLTAVADPAIINPIYYWYRNTSDTATLLHTGPTLVVPNVRTNMIYYAAVKGDNFCETTPQNRRQAQISIQSGQGALVTVNPIDGRACGTFSGSFTASTTATLTNPVYRWYNASYTLLYTGPTYSVSGISSNTVFRVSVSGDGVCESSPERQAQVPIYIGGINSITLSYEHLIGCDNKGSVIFATVNGGALPFEYRVDSETSWIVSNTPNIVIPGQSSGSHTVYVKDFCSTEQATINIPSHPEGEVDRNMLSYSDGPAAYGIAEHVISGCVYLGGLELSKVQSVPAPTRLANTAQNDDALDLTYDGLGFVDLVTSGIQANSGQLRLNLKATNKTLMTARIYAWIDVNKNLKYSVNELIGQTTVAPGSNNANVLLIGTGSAYNYLRNDSMYLRLRITTQTMTGTAIDDPVRNLGNGEVEDYMLELGELYSFKKEVSVKSKPGATEFVKGDTLIYRIEFENKSVYPMCVQIFDTVPAGTQYISGADNYLSNVARWNSVSVNAGQFQSRTFMVKVGEGTSYVSNTAHFVFCSTTDTLSSNTVSMESNIMNLANDYYSIMTCGSETIDILSNDEIPTGATVSVSKTPKYGSASIAGNNLIYNNSGGSGLTCSLSGGRRDTIKYRVCNSTNTVCREASVIINLLRRPEFALRDSCSRRPYIVLTFHYPGATYDWFYSDDDGLNWTSEATASGTKLYITKGGLYRVRVNYKGNSYELTNGLKVILNRKATISGGLIWYEMSSVQAAVTWP